LYPTVRVLDKRRFPVDVYVKYKGISAMPVKLVCVILRPHMPKETSLKVDVTAKASMCLQDKMSSEKRQEVF
jgi:hypothetical protein